MIAIEQEDSDELVCPRKGCLYTTNNPLNLNYHSSNYHRKNKLKVCFFCGFLSLKERAIESHSCRHEDAKKKELERVLKMKRENNVLTTDLDDDDEAANSSESARKRQNKKRKCDQNVCNLRRSNRIKTRKSNESKNGNESDANASYGNLDKACKSKDGKIDLNSSIKDLLNSNLPTSFKNQLNEMIILANDEKKRLIMEKLIELDEKENNLV